MKKLPVKKKPLPKKSNSAYLDNMRKSMDNFVSYKKQEEELVAEIQAMLAVEKIADVKEKANLDNEGYEFSFFCNTRTVCLTISREDKLAIVKVYGFIRLSPYYKGTPFSDVEYFRPRTKGRKKGQINTSKAVSSFAFLCRFASHHRQMVSALRNIASGNVAVNIFPKKGRIVAKLEIDELDVADAKRVLEFVNNLGGDA